MDNDGMTHITIIGMGLIGTSLGLALRAASDHPPPLGQHTITGYDQDSAAVATARGRLAIDRPARTLEAAVQGADIVVLATPVQVVRSLLATLGPLLATGTVVTDVSSTKAQVCAWAAELLPDGVHFVGGHPMAGREQAGPAAADPTLFQGAIYCLTPAATTPPTALDRVEALVTLVGAKPYYLDPDEHDAYVAAISHLPFLLSAAMVALPAQSPAWREMAALAASGFRDVTRLASGDVVMHRDICMTNRAALVRWINDMIALLAETRDHLEQNQVEPIEHLFQHARMVREAWLTEKPHLRPGEAAFEQEHQTERPGLFRFRRPPERS